MSSRIYTSNTAAIVTTPTEANTFQRIEDKFLIKAEHFNTFCSVVAERMEPCYPDPTTKYTLIESCYFDSEDLDVYNSHFNKTEERFKLRTRRYGPNGVWGNDYFLELKLKNHGISMKERLAVGIEDIQNIQGGKGIELTQALIDRNSGTKLKKIEKRLARINQLIGLFHLRPQCAVTYKRFAFEGNDGFRVTIDSKIQNNLLNQISSPTIMEIFGTENWVKAQEMRNNFLKTDHYLVEVKHTGTIPQWCQILLGIIGGTQASFSKYCYSITSSITEDKGKLK